MTTTQTTTQPRKTLSDETGRAHAAPPMPTFLVIGATKGGTTSLYHYLDQHPDIYMSHPVKEPKFFAAEENSVVRENGAKGWRLSSGHITELANYQALFQGSTRERARGEASPQYLYYPEVPQRIWQRLPEVELIAILRHPVERAYSAFLHQTRDGMETHLDFAAALVDEPKRIQEGWSPLYHYRAQGFYYEQLTRYYQLFAADKIHVYLYDDLKKDPLGLMRNIYKDVGVDANFSPSLEVQHNISGVPKNRALHRIHGFFKGSYRSPLKEVGKRLLPQQFRGALRRRTVQGLEKHNLAKPSLEPAVREALQAAYREDIQKLQGLIDRDLSSWLSTS